MPNAVTETAAAPPAVAAEHFAGKLAFETDCADVHDALKRGEAGFVLLEARGPGAYARGHVPGALNLPHRSITEEALAAWPPDTLFVVYCAGPALQRRRPGGAALGAARPAGEDHAGRHGGVGCGGLPRR